MQDCAALEEICESVFKLCFSLCVFKPPLLITQSSLIGQLTHAWASTPNTNRVAVQIIS